MPPFASLLVIILFPQQFENNKNLPDLWWVVLVLLIDVGHVYSTLYRTYFDPAALKKQRSLLWTIPFFGFVAGVLMYSISHMLFWRLLAYVAVFHFIRQQYGFMRVYSRKESKIGFSSLIDNLSIYTAALCPLLYWHLRGPRNFNWFLEGDFFYLDVQALIFPLTVVYIVILAAYFCKEMLLFARYDYLNIPKIAIVSGTTLSWYFGIVYYNGDMAFTLLNVISHGIPYIGLVYLHGRKLHAKQSSNSRLLRLVFNRFGWVFFLIIIFLFAFIEEGIWDLTVWQEHNAVFGWRKIINLNLSEQTLSILVPLLALPQITHYILDGFIWKVKDDDFAWGKYR